MTVAVIYDPSNFDMSYPSQSVGEHGINLAYDRLLRFTTGPDRPYIDQTLQPALAERWEVSLDARAFTFHLRKGARFHAVPPLNGRELTAADVKWTLEYRTRTGELKDKGLPRGEADFLFEGMERVDTPDPYTAIVRFKEPFSPFVNYAASSFNPILPREIFEADGHFKDKIVGTGPFILDVGGSQKGTRWVWKRNAAYWDPGMPYLDEIRWVVLPSDAAQAAAFQAKQLDILTELLYTSFEEVRKGSPQANHYKYLATNPQLLFLSQARGGPLTDVRVRRAISLSVDRDQINRTMSGGEGVWAMPGTPVGLLYSEAETRQLMRQSVDEAKRLLNEAGQGSGLNLEWRFARDTAQSDVVLFELVQAQVKRAGINIALIPMDRAEQRNLRRRGDFDLDANTGGLAVLNADIDSLVNARYHSAASQNYAKIKDPELDELLETFRAETDPPKRREVHRKISLRILEMVWNVDLVYPPNWDIWHPHVRNYHPHFTERPTYRDAWVER